MKKKTLKQINANIKTTEELVMDYKSQRDELKLRPIKNSHVMLGVVTCATAGMIMAATHTLDYGNMVVFGIGGGVCGYFIPTMIRKVRIGELNYNIYINNLIIKDLNKEKNELVKTKKLKV